MKTITLRRLALVLMALAFIAGTQGAYAQGVPANQGRVTDIAGVLKTSQKEALAHKLKMIEDNNPDKPQVVVLLPATLGGKSVEDYATDVFRKWGVGQKGKDNGVMIIIAPKERMYKIETGYGVDSVIPDGQTRAIGDKYIGPHVQSGKEDYFTALDGAIGAIGKFLVPPAKADAITTPAQASKGIPAWMWVVFAIAVILMIGMAVRAMRPRRAVVTSGLGPLPDLDSPPPSSPYPRRDFERRDYYDSGSERDRDRSYDDPYRRLDPAHQPVWNRPPLAPAPASFQTPSSGGGHSTSDMLTGAILGGLAGAAIDHALGGERRRSSSGDNGFGGGSSSTREPDDNDIKLGGGLSGGAGVASAFNDTSDDTDDDTDSSDDDSDSSDSSSGSSSDD